MIGNSASLGQGFHTLALTFLPLSTQSVQKVLSLNPKLGRTSKEKCPDRSGNNPLPPRIVALE
jgi:hypothetical protein